MPLAFAYDAVIEKGPQSSGSLFQLIGTLTFSGSYATGGDQITMAAVNTNFETILKRSGLGRVLFVHFNRGYTAEWVTATKLLKIWSSANTELAAGAYNAALTASPMQIIVVGR